MATMDARIPTVYTTANLTVSIIFPILSFLAVLIRFSARRTTRQKLQADDWWVLFTWFVTLALSTVPWAVIPRSGMNYLKGNTQEEITNALLLETKGTFVQSILLQVALTTVKFSILLLYKRIFPIGRFLMVANGFIFIIGLWGIIYFFFIIFMSWPVSGAWTSQGRQIFDPYGLSVSRNALSMFFDLAVLVLPLPMVYRLHMSLSKKIAVMGIFWLGAFCCIASALSLAYLVMGQQAAADSASSGGYTQIDRITMANLFVLIEPNCSIIAACLPCYGPLLKKGRSMDSIIKSVRSLVSLRSNRSQSLGSDADGAVKTGDSKLKQRTDDSSALELQKPTEGWENWDTKAQHEANATAESGMEQQQKNPSAGIVVTRTYQTDG